MARKARHESDTLVLASPKESKRKFERIMKDMREGRLSGEDLKRARVLKKCNAIGAEILRLERKYGPISF
jgi:hypothetical protein